MFIAALFSIAKTWKQPKCSSTDMDNNVDYTYTHTHTHTHIYIYIYIYIMEYYSTTKKNEICHLPATWEDLEIIILREVRQEKAIILCYCLYVESK